MSCNVEFEINELFVFCYINIHLYFLKFEWIFTHVWFLSLHALVIGKHLLLCWILLLFRSLYVSKTVHICLYCHLFHEKILSIGKQSHSSGPQVFQTPVFTSDLHVIVGHRYFQLFLGVTSSLPSASIPSQNNWSVSVLSSNNGVRLKSNWFSPLSSCLHSALPCDSVTPPSVPLCALPLCPVNGYTVWRMGQDLIKFLLLHQEYPDWCGHSSFLLVTFCSFGATCLDLHGGASSFTRHCFTPLVRVSASWKCI